MPTAIKCDLVVGEILYFTVLKGIYSVSIEQIIRIDSIITTLLRETEYFTQFSINDIDTFCDNYHYLVSPLKNNTVTILPNKQNVEIHKRLRHSFLTGVPYVFIEAVEKATNIIVTDKRSNKNQAGTRTIRQSRNERKITNGVNG